MSEFVTTPTERVFFLTGSHAEIQKLSHFLGENALEPVIKMAGTDLRAVQRMGGE